MKKTLVLLSLMIASVMSVNAQGGYRGFFEVIPSYKEGLSFDVTTAHGWQFNQNWFLGVGFGVVNIADNENLEEYGVDICAPIFAKVRYDLLSEKALTWFADLNVGYSIFQEEEYIKLFYSSFSVGLRQRLTEKLGLNYGVGCSIIPSDDLDCLLFNVKIGVDF